MKSICINCKFVHTNNSNVTGDWKCRHPEQRPTNFVNGESSCYIVNNNGQCTLFEAKNDQVA